MIPESILELFCDLQQITLINLPTCKMEILTVLFLALFCYEDKLASFKYIEVTLKIQRMVWLHGYTANTGLDIFLFPICLYLHHDKEHHHSLSHPVQKSRVSLDPSSLRCSLSWVPFCMFPNARPTLSLLLGLTELMHPVQ